MWAMFLTIGEGCYMNGKEETKNEPVVVNRNRRYQHIYGFQKIYIEEALSSEGLGAVAAQ